MVLVRSIAKLGWNMHETDVEHKIQGQVITVEEQQSSIRTK